MKLNKTRTKDIKNTKLRIFGQCFNIDYIPQSFHYLKANIKELRTKLRFFMELFFICLARTWGDQTSAHSPRFQKVIFYYEVGYLINCEDYAERNILCAVQLELEEKSLFSYSRKIYSGFSWNSTQKKIMKFVKIFAKMFTKLQDKFGFSYNQDPTSTFCKI